MKRLKHLAEGQIPAQQDYLHLVDHDLQMTMGTLLIIEDLTREIEDVWEEIRELFLRKLILPFLQRTLEA